MLSIHELRGEGGRYWGSKSDEACLLAELKRSLGSAVKCNGPLYWPFRSSDMYCVGALGQ